MEYPWPGNVRELRNFCERLSVFCETEYAGKKDVMMALYSGGAYQRKKEKGTAVCDGRKKREKGRDEKEELLEALETCTSSFEEMIAWVDEHGNLTDVPPEERARKAQEAKQICCCKGDCEAL